MLPDGRDAIDLKLRIERLRTVSESLAARSTHERERARMLTAQARLSRRIRWERRFEEACFRHDRALRTVGLGAD